MLCLSCFSFGKYVYFAFCFNFLNEFLWTNMFATAALTSCLAFIADSTTWQMLRPSVTSDFTSQKFHNHPHSYDLLWSLGGCSHNGGKVSTACNHGMIEIQWVIIQPWPGLRIFLGHVVQQGEDPAREAAVDQQTRDAWVSQCMESWEGACCHLLLFDV